MSYSVSPAFSCTRARRLSIGFACAFVAGAALAEPAASQEILHPGVYVREIVIHTGEPVSGGEARIVEPRDFGQSDRAPGRIVLEVSPGPLQRALERAHDSGTAFGLSGRMPAPADAGEQAYLTIELEDIIVTSYSMAGRARVVLASASNDAVEGHRRYRPITIRKRLGKSAIHDGGKFRSRGEVDRAESREGIVLEVDGVAVARFAEVSGLNTAARAKWANITMKRGVTEGPGMRRWHEAGRTRGSSARKNGSIIQYDTQGRPVARWNFENAWPMHYERGAHGAGAGEALASVTLEVENIRRVGP